MSDKIDELCNAIKDNALPLVKHLIENRIDLNVLSKDGRPPLMIAIVQNRYEIAELLLKNGAHTDITCENNGTALHVATAMDNTSFITLLLNYKADINILGVDNSSTPLHFAAYIDNAEAVKVLVENGANINAQNEDKVTPLRIAVQRMSINAIHMLYKLGADPDIKDKDGNTVYDYCRFNELLEKMEDDNTIII